MTTTPSMGLILPVVAETTGPEWASLLNTALETVDSHTHASGSGVQVPTAGLNINADLGFNEWAATSVDYLGLVIQETALDTGSAKVFAYNGELYYRDASSNNVRLTLNGAVDAGATGAITGLTSPASASYSTLTETFTWLADTGLSAKMAVSDLVVYAYGEVSPNPVTIKSPAALGAAYTILLPAAVPAATYPITMTAAGILGNSGTIGLAAGAVGTPSVAFAADLNTGLYSIGADNLGVAVGGVKQVDLSTTVAAFSQVVRQGTAVPSGTASVPAYSFGGDTDTGMYLGAADRINFACGGTNVIRFGTTGLLVNLPGSAATPAFGVDDTDTGLYAAASNTLGITAAATHVASFSAGLLAVTGDLTVSDDLTVTDNVTIGSTLQIDGGGTFKVSRFTGTLTGLSNVSIDIGATIYGVFGWATYNSGSNFTPIADQLLDGAVFDRVYIDNGGGTTSTEVVLVNGDTSSSDYRLMVFHA